MKNNKIYKYDKNGNPLTLSNTDKEDIIYWETIAQEAIDDTLKGLYAKGISSVHGDKKGIYEISSDYDRTYLKINKKNEKMKEDRHPLRT